MADNYFIEASARHTSRYMLLSGTTCLSLHSHGADSVPTCLPAAFMGVLGCTHGARGAPTSLRPSASSCRCNGRLPNRLLPHHAPYCLRWELGRGEGERWDWGMDEYFLGCVRTRRVDLRKKLDWLMSSPRGRASNGFKLGQLFLD